MKSDLTYIDHIEDCLKTIIGYVENLSQIDFMQNQMVQDATIRQNMFLLMF